MSRKTALPIGIGLGTAITAVVIALALFRTSDEQRLSQAGDQPLGAASESQRKPASPADTFHGIITSGQVAVGVLTGQGVYDKG